MTTTGLEVRLCAGRTKPSVNRFTRTLDDVVLSLKEIDRLYLRRGSRPIWVVDSLRHDARTSIVRLEPRTNSRTRPLEDMLEPVKAFVDGVKELEQFAEIPRLYGPETVERIRRIASTGDEYSNISLASYNGTTGTTVTLTEKVRDNAGSAVQGKDISHGSMSGILDTVGTTPRKNLLRVRVFDKQSQRAVSGSAAPHLSESLREHWNHKVLVGGQITRNAQGQAIRIEIDRIERLPEDDLMIPSPKELLGIAPDWTGGVSVDDFMRGIRNA